LTRLSRATCARVVVSCLHVEPTAVNTIIASNTSKKKKRGHPESGHPKSGAG
jgi:hypothetical protein